MFIYITIDSNEGGFMKLSKLTEHIPLKLKVLKRNAYIYFNKQCLKINIRSVLTDDLSFSFINFCDILSA